MQPTRPQDGALALDDDRILDSWKEISAYLGRAVRTVQRWEKEEGLPIHRHQHSKAGTVFAYASELDAWRHQRDDSAPEGPESANKSSRSAWMASTMGLGLVLIAATLWWTTSWKPRIGATNNVPTAPAERHDWLLVADLDNQTGNEALDDVLRTALERELTDSVFLKVASEARIGDVLRLTGRAPDTPIDASLARELALRDGGIRAVLAGSVERVGTTYLLSVDLLDPAAGASLKSLSVEAATEDAIPPALKSLAGRTREALGETLPHLGVSAGLSRVSTPSLRALQLYTQADQLLAEGAFGVAESLLRESIEEDPGFASAYTHLAWAVRNQGPQQEERYLPYAEQALDLADRATSVERQFIRGSYYHMRSRATQSHDDASTALRHYRALLELDPGHSWAAGNAERLLQELGRGREIPDLLLRRLEARPNDIGIVSQMARALVVIEADLQEARIYARRAEGLRALQGVEDDRWQPFLEYHLPLHELWVAGDVERLVAELDRIVDSLPDRPAAERENLAAVVLEHYLDLGMFRRASDVQASYGLYPATVWERELAGRRHDKDFLVERLMERRAGANLARQTRDAFSLAVLGRTADAERILAEIPPQIGLVAERNVLAARGSVDAARGRYDEAIPKLQQAFDLLRHDRSLRGYFRVATVLSRALWEVGQRDQSMEVLEEASRQQPRLLHFHRQLWMEVELDLAATYRRLGREADAAQIENQLRRYSTFADPDFPVLLELDRRAGSQVR